MIRITEANDVFIMDCDMTENRIPKSHGWRFDWDTKTWRAEHYTKANPLRQYMDDKALALLERLSLDHSWGVPPEDVLEGDRVMVMQRKDVPMEEPAWSSCLRCE